MGFIRPSAVRAFLQQPRPDFRKWRDYPLAKLQRIMEKRLPVRPPIWKKLAKHQRVALLLGAINERFCFWMDTGTGKTLTSIALARYFIRAKRAERSLVLVPAKVNRDEWAREIRKHSPNTPHVVLRGSTTQKWRTLETVDADIFIDTYAGFTRMVSTTKAVTKKGKTKNKLVMNPTRMKKVAARVQGLIMDESIQVVMKGKHGSLQHRVCRKLSRMVVFAFALNGTPFGRDPQDIWGQMFVVDHGKTLGPTLGLFRAAFFTESENFWGGSEYKFKHRMEPDLHRMMAAGSIRYEVDEADLPRVVPVIKKVKLGRDANDMYIDAMEKMRAARGNPVAQENSFIRMRQISSGWIGYKDDVEGTRARYEFKENPKLDALLEMIDEINGAYKAIVYYDFTHSGDMIERALKERGVGTVRIYGKTKDAAGVLAKFDASKKHSVLILQNSMAVGLNLQVARYGLVFESAVAAVMRKQADRRFIRQYSNHKSVVLADFVAAGTYDERILQYHKQGADLFRAIVDGKA
jgi:SNF2 family DNA or RNA helicase